MIISISHLPHKSGRNTHIETEHPNYDLALESIPEENDVDYDIAVEMNENGEDTDISNSDDESPIYSVPNKDDFNI